MESNVSFKESLSHTFPVLKPKNSVVTSVNVRKGRANLKTGNSGDERAGQISWLAIQSVLVWKQTPAVITNEVSCSAMADTH